MSENTQEVKQEKVFNVGFTQVHLTILLAVIAVASTAFIIVQGFVSKDSFSSTLVAQINGIVLFLASFFGTCAALMGAKVNIYKELVEEHNVALAIFLLGIAYGLSSIIAKVVL